MAKTSAAMIIVCLMIFLFGDTRGDTNIGDGGIEHAGWNEFLAYICTQGYTVRPASICNSFTTTTTVATTTSTTHSEESVEDKPIQTPTTTSKAPSTTQLTGSALERAHWCRFNNGSYLALGQTFIYNQCSLCQCIQSRAIRCTQLQCMATYCMDNTASVVRNGQCCQQCAYENASRSCVVSGITFPHGTFLRRTTDNIQCWCQSGTVECRKSSTSSLSQLDYWGDGTGIYVIVIVIIGILIIGLLLCCVGGAFFYYYFYYNQQTFQDAYEQYYSNAGWQEMPEDGQVIVDEKQAEAEAQKYEYQPEQTAEYVPPPYALYNSPIANPNEQKSA